MVKSRQITIREMLDMEPRIQNIASHVRHEENWDMAYIKAKREAARLVGWGAELAELQSESAYNAFIAYICGELDKVYRDGR